MGKVAVLLAALGVGTSIGWPDVVAAGIMATTTSGAAQILRHAAEDLRAVSDPAE